ncbi:major facilitator superfamily domain-containing protein [Filobasidium floriforme]|uniref:major facilitator superfamily domain-containing protein n=1 Tax=Filobasidium floriforme TaxID=5210 RepID=UPI001E8E5841|nr:major facilitator superfamily domain-containing protein [Filobasidium floriforme]KAH8079626.1 major facilitator superfamily domain-containing protein [Filobasidium floriforme]
MVDSISGGSGTAIPLQSVSDDKTKEDKYEPGNDDAAVSPRPESTNALPQLENERREPESELDKKVERKWMAAIYGLMFLAGWSDATTGPLLLRIQSHYSVSYPIVSLLFICAFVGFFTAAVINIWLTDKIGYGKALVLASGCQVAAFAIQASKPPFPLFLISYTPNGIGMGLQDALGNTFITRLPGASNKMALAHAMYGLGAFVVPLVATQFARRTPQMEGRWNYHYLVSLGVALANTLGLVWVFKGKREEVLFEEQGFTPVGGEIDEKIEIDAEHLDSNHADGNLNQEDDNDLTAEDVSPSSKALGSHTKFKRILSSPFIHLVAAFSLLYVGIEVTIGGWAVTFIVEARGGGDDSGYVSSGFFGGLMVGRIVQIGVGRFVSEHRIVYVYTGIALALEIVIWQTTGIIGNAVCYAFIGLVLGPIYPIMMNVTAAVIDPELAGGAIGYIAALGQCGSAVFPWITGALAGRYGVWALQPLLVAMLALEGMLWAVVLFMSRHKWKRIHKF